MKVRDPHFRLERIRKYIDEDIFPARVVEKKEITNWKYTEHTMEEKLNDAGAIDYPDDSWADFELLSSWGGYDKVAWFRQRVEIPESFRNKTVAFRGIVGPRDGGDSTAEVLLYVDGNPIQGIDIWHEEAFLDPDIYEDKKEITIALKAWSGVLGVPRVRVFKEAALLVIDEYTDKFYFMVDTLLKSMELLKESDLRRIQITKILVDTFQRVDFLHYKKEQFYASIQTAYEYLAEKVEELAKVEEIKPTVTGVGHSHIDMGWLWRYSATREKASRTFSTVLNLMRQFPEYRFLHTSPQLYKFLEKDYPEIFAKVKEKIQEGQWEITGGMWVEPDTNLPTGESLIRQFLFGKRYMKEEFQMDSKLVWLPDVFGYSGALPQIMKKSDMDYFMTTKISWNQYNHFPYDTFWWKGIDGTRIFTHFITTPEDGSWFYTYNGQMQPEEIPGIWENYKDKDKNHELLLAFGWGDGGGGPTKDMLERARVMKNIPGIPKVQIDTTENYFKRIYNEIDHDDLGEWDGELYFEYHRGTYTSQAKVKRDNRKAEVLLHNIEFLCSYADILTKEDAYPCEELTGMWEDVLLNQFHDVLPGSSIRQVYEDTDAMYQALYEKGQKLLEDAQRRIAQALGLSKEQLVIFNTTGWSRADSIFVPYSKELNEETCFYANEKQLKHQNQENGKLVWVEDIPAYGYKIVEMSQDKSSQASPQISFKESSDFTIENSYFTIKLNEAGQIAYLYDKEEERVVSAQEPMNVFTAFEDKPQRFDAWDIDVYYKEKPYPIPKLVKREIIQEGPIEAILRQTFEFEASTIVQDMVIYSDKKRIDFRTKVDWKEKQVLLRVFFPVDIHASNATYEIQCGNIERPTHTNTEWDFAKFEVCAQKWVDLSEEGYGVALLNDCKYGHDIHANTIAMTLIKSSVRPDETADRREHEFTYSIYPHIGTVKQSMVQKEAMELNIPLACTQGILEDKVAKTISGGLFTTDCDFVVLDTVKRAEEENAYVIRFYEYKNKKGNVQLRFNLPVKKVIETNLIERELEEIEVKDNSVQVSVHGYEIKTLKVYFN